MVDAEQGHPSPAIGEAGVRFYCALSKVEKQTLRYQRLKDWHIWFAWKPVRILEKRTGRWKWVWLEFVSRRWIPVDPVFNARLALWGYDFPAVYP